MLFRFLLVLLLVTCSHYALAAKRTIETVKPVVAEFKALDKAAIAARVHYPLKRKVPLSPIADQQQMLARFDEVFDSELVEQISRSHLRRDWQAVGWRGIMFDEGKLWLDFDGAIWSVPYESEAEKLRREALIEQQKKALHPSIQKYLKPKLMWQTASHIIRIDEVTEDNFRLVMWDKAQTTQDKPEVIIEQGRLSFDGSGGNHFYTFNRDQHRYVCQVIVLGADDTPAGTFQVYKNNQLTLDEPVLEEIE